MNNSGGGAEVLGSSGEALQALHEGSRIHIDALQVRLVPEIDHLGDYGYLVLKHGFRLQAGGGIGDNAYHDAFPLFLQLTQVG
jgi:hypothetical protein